MKVIVTGASGFVGQALVRNLVGSANEVVALSRRTLELPGVHWQPYELFDPAPVALPAGAAVVFHLAATTVSAEFDEGKELESARRIIAAARGEGARLIFVSSQSAGESASTSYGRAKWAIENEVQAAHGVVVRPGFVYGGDASGLFGRLVALTTSPVLPDFLPRPLIQPIHVDDLAQGLVLASLRPDLEGRVLRLGADAPVPFTQFLREIAYLWARKTPVFVSFPRFLVVATRRGLGKSASARLGLTRLLSLFELKPMSSAEDLACLKLKLRPHSLGLARRARRTLLEENHALLAYVLRDRPTTGMLRRLTRAVDISAGGTPLGLPPLFCKFPVLIGAVDRGKRVPPEASRRLDWAVMCVEASAAGASRFLRLGKSKGLLHSSLAITMALSEELMWRVTSPLFRLLLRFCG